MALRDEIVPFIDGNGLVCSTPFPPGTLAACTNGIMYTSELYVMYEKSGQLTDQDKLDYAQKIGQCINSEGMLCRLPIGQGASQEEVDDLYAFANACTALGNTSMPRTVLWSIIKNLGFMDTVNPGSHSNWASFMPRQLQLMACLVTASFPSWKNPLHILIRLLCNPLYVYSALIIATACWWTDPNNTDSRRLSWHLQNNVKKVSPLCWLASLIWMHVLKNAYGPAEMCAVADLYYQPSGVHPFCKYWIT